MRKFIFIITLIFLLSVMPYLIKDASAQPPPPPAQEIPIDGGIAALIVAGAAYGARQIRKQQKQEEKD